MILAKGGVTDYATKHRWQNRVRWRVASMLNRLPFTCWARLVDWALHSRPLWNRDGDDVRRDFMCEPSPGCERCYCGKLVSRQIWEDEPA